MNILGIILYTLFFAFLTAYIAQIKNFNPKKWFYFGIVLGIIAFIIILIEKKQLSSHVSLSSE
tara:strand:- start:123 stop:311 length:189 start_codon:yes stop_codon:yes gene_type:complete